MINTHCIYVHPIEWTDNIFFKRKPSINPYLNSLLKLKLPWAPSCATGEETTTHIFTKLGWKEGFWTEDCRTHSPFYSLNSLKCFPRWNQTSWAPQTRPHLLQAPPPLESLSLNLAWVFVIHFETVWDVIKNGPVKICQIYWKIVSSVSHSNFFVGLTEKFLPGPLTRNNYVFLE